MQKLVIDVFPSLQEEIDKSDKRTQKLFQKQKQFMEMHPNYPSLGRTKLEDVVDKYGDPLWEIRLDRKRRIVFVERDRGNRIIWLKLVDHDAISRNIYLNPKGAY